MISAYVTCAVEATALMHQTIVIRTTAEDQTSTPWLPFFSALRKHVIQVKVTVKSPDWSSMFLQLVVPV